MTYEDLAVRVEDAHKSYGETAVLSALHMNVPNGSIYGLLGPSGCGKTTLLNCIVGRSKLDSGDIYINIKSKAKMGYMPQELSLYVQFSIEETLYFYGVAYGMTREAIDENIDRLVSALDLPPKHQSIQFLSGGQQRRVSLCVALLHNPQLLILDEPTVGVDPLLSHSIWEQLKRMCSEGNKTIIITTHYIEEARQAQRIGLLRNGSLLAEEEPNTLMAMYNSDTLEKVFLQLSQKQSSNNNNRINYRVPSLMENFRMGRRKPEALLSEGTELQWCRIKAQLMRAGFWMRRNIPIMLFLLLLPIVQSALFCVTVGLDPKGLKIGTVNSELSLHNLTTCPHRPAFNSCTPSLLSCHYFSLLTNEKFMILENYQSTEEAREGTLRNHVWGFLEVPHNYSDSLYERLRSNMDSPDPALLFSEIDVHLDMSNQYIGNLLRRDFLLGYLDFLKQLYTDCGWKPKASGIPIHFEEAIYGSNNPSFSHFAIPAVIQLFEFYLPMMFTVGAILMEKRDGILERTLITGITLGETLITHIMVQMIVLTVQTALMMVVIFVLFSNPLEGSLFLCLSLLYLIGISGMCYGFFVATLCDQDNAAAYMGLGSFFPLAMLSGMIWPFEGMHWTLRAVGWFLPLTQTTESFRAIMTRAWPITHPSVFLGFFSAVGWILFFSISCYSIIKIQNGIRGSIKIPIISTVLRRKY